MQTGQIVMFRDLSLRMPTTWLTSPPHRAIETGRSSASSAV